MIRLGDLVACVVPCYPTRVYGDEAVPHVGIIYTIRDIRNDAPGRDCGFLLHEIRNPRRLYNTPNGPAIVELGFYFWHFRPVARPDISALTALLNPIRAAGEVSAKIEAAARLSRARP